MKYLLTLLSAYFVLIAADLFFLRMFPHSAISVSLMFLLASAVAAPQKTRFVYRALFPIIIVCGLVGDILSSRGLGIVFTTYILIALVVVLVVKNLPQGGNVQIFVFIFFVMTFVYRIAMYFIGGIRDVAFFPQLFSALSSSLYCSVGALILLIFINSRKFEKLSKLLFRED